MFEDVFGPLDDVLKDTPEDAAEWDTGETWDSGEKENIWRAEPAAKPGAVWTTGSGGCPPEGCSSCEDECETDCDDDCVVEEQETPAPDPAQTGAGHSGNDGIPGNSVPDSDGLSESEQLDEFDDELEMSEEEDEIGSPTGVFDDIF